MRAILLCVSLGLLAILLAFIFVTRDARLAAPERTEHCWSAQVGGKWYFAYVTAEERGSQRALSPGRFSAYTTDQYNRYRLTVRSLPDGEIVGESALGDIPRNQNRPRPVIVGIVGDVLWLWHGQLAAYSLPGLVLRSDESIARAARPADADLMPREAKQFKVLKEPPGLLMRGRDARFYLIDPDAFALRPIAATQLPPSTFSTQPEHWFDFITTASEGRTMTSAYNQMTQILLDRRGTWLGLLSDSECEGLQTWVAHDNRPTGDVARSLYRTSYTRNERGGATIDPNAVVRVGTGSYLQAGFLFQHGFVPWELTDPASALVITKKRLGADEPWQLTRLDYDGQSLWHADTGLADPDELLDAGPYLMIAGRPTDAASTDQRPQQVIRWIDVRTGVKGTLCFATGEKLP